MSHPLYTVKDWDSVYENSRSRAVSDLKWVSIPNKHDGEGYGLVMEQEDAAELFAAWVLIIQVASKCQRRGTLARDDGSPLTARSLAMKTRAPEAWFAKALKFFTHKTLWLECHPAITEPSPCHHSPVTVPSPAHQVSADRIEGNRIGENRNEGNPSLPSSETYVLSPPLDRSPREGGMDGWTSVSSEKNVEPSARPMSEAAFLLIAKKLQVPEEFARTVFLDLEATNWTSANGTRVVSPASYLRDLWARHRTKPAPAPAGTAPAGRSDGPREPWQIDADIARLKAMVKRVCEAPGSKNPPGPDWSKHREKFEADWLEVVQKAHDEAREKLPGEFKVFERNFAEAEAQARKGGNYDAGGDMARVFRLVQFAEAFPKDCPDFARWDREWNKGRSWVDPEALTAEAKAEVRLLKVRLKELEEERKRALVGGGK